MIIVDTALKARAGGWQSSPCGHDWGRALWAEASLTKFSITFLVCGWSLISNRTLENAKQAYALAGAEEVATAHTVEQLDSAIAAGQIRGY